MIKTITNSVCFGWCGQICLLYKAAWGINTTAILYRVIILNKKRHADHLNWCRQHFVIIVSNIAVIFIIKSILTYCKNYRAPLTIKFNWVVLWLSSDFGADMIYNMFFFSNSSCLSLINCLVIWKLRFKVVRSAHEHLYLIILRFHFFGRESIVFLVWLDMDQPNGLHSMIEG